METKKTSRESSYIAVENIKEQKYWNSKLSDEIIKSAFPPDKTNLENNIPVFESYSFDFSQELEQKVTKITGNSDPKLFMVLMTNMNILLQRYSGNSDLIIGTPIENQGIEGNFVNKVLAIRNNVTDDISFKNFLIQVRETIIEATENQNYPIEALLYDLKFDNDTSEFPLFDVAVLLNNFQSVEYLSDININTVFTFDRNDESISGTIKYNSNLFSEEYIKKIADHFCLILINSLTDIDQKISDIKTLTEAEEYNIISGFNDTQSKFSDDKTFQDLFEEQVKKTPQNIAVRSEGIDISYKELNERANIIANRLLEIGVKPNTVVSLMGVRNIEILIGIVGTLKAGAAYLPINAKDPEARLKYIIQDSNSRVLISQKGVVDNNSFVKEVIGDENIIFIDDILNIDLANQKVSTPKTICNSNDLAYLIYTSGTTGKPKGVKIHHSAMINYLAWSSKTYVRGENLDFPLYTSFSFDMTITSIFTPLITGNAILVYAGGEKEFILEKVINDNKSGVLKATPSHLKMLVDNQEVFKQNSQNGSSLKIKRLIIGGEELNTQIVKDVDKFFNGEVEIYNEYGPTEATVGCMIHKYNPDIDKKHSLPIGVPIDNTQIYILDSKLSPVPYNVAGEIYISGNSLSKGYIHKPEFTASKFIDNPFIPGEKMYRSGDLAKMNNDGIVEFIGRVDHQVKIRGFRIELGEIESKIVDYQKGVYKKYSENIDVKETWNLKDVKRCKKCLLPENYPGIHFDDDGVCDICNEFIDYKEKSAQFFKTPEKFTEVIEKARATKNSDYDCLLLYSGGKDSSYVLHKLVDNGLKVLAFTYDNGYVSKTAFENIKRTTSILNVDHLIVDSEYMNEVFVESLRTEHNVCNGCFKGVNTIGTKIASDYNINLVISGLSRGQIFDIKLQGLFRLGIFDEETINERLKLFRKEYYSMKNRTSRLLNVVIEDETVDNTYFEDYFEYDDISVSEIFDYLKQKDEGWSRPNDTGLSSSNCMINDVGIYVHLKDTGHHFYEAQLSWDVRLGTLSMEEGLEEITDFKIHPDTNKILTDIGYFKEPSGAVVIDNEDKNGEKYLCAYVVGNKEFKISDLKSYLSSYLPDYMIPARFVKIDMIPISESGKINRKALPDPELNIEVEYVAPQNDIQKQIVQIWAKLLDVDTDKIGIDYNFFDMGGHSLKATMFVAKLHEEMNITVPLTDIFTKPTIRKLSETIAAIINLKNGDSEVDDKAKKLVI